MSTAEPWIIYYFVFALQKLDVGLDSKEMGWEIKWLVQTLKFSRQRISKLLFSEIWCPVFGTYLPNYKRQMWEAPNNNKKNVHSDLQDTSYIGTEYF
jgi:hypothetical protein